MSKRPQQVATMRIRKTWVSRILLGIPFAFLMLPVTIAKPLDPATWVIDVVLAAIYAALCVLIGRAWIEVTDEGIVKHGVFGARSLRWDEVTSYWYSANPRGNSSPAMIGGGTVEGIATAAESRWGKAVRIAYTLRLRAADGRELRITSGFARADEAIAASLGRLQPRLAEAARARLAKGEPVEAGALVLTRERLRWRDKEPLPLARIEQAEIFGSNGRTFLRLLERGKAWRYASIDARRVPAVPLLLELLRDLGVPVRVPGWFVP